MSQEENGRATSDDELWEYAASRPRGNRLGIALSGGGVRSSAFSLGAIQALEDNELLRRARFLSAVSGGSYTAAGYLSCLAMSEPETLRNSGPGWRSPWSQGSPEETYLARNLGYLARGIGGRVWFTVNLLYGLIMNLLPLLFGSFVLGRLLGELLYEYIHPDLGDGSLNQTTVLVSTAGALALVLVGIGTVLVRRLRDADASTDASTANAAHINTARTLSIAAVGVVGVFTALPAAALGLHRVLVRLDLAAAETQGPNWVAGRMTISLLLIAASLAIGGLAVLMLRTGRMRLLAFGLSSVSGPVLLLTPCLLAVESSAIRDWDTARDLPLLLVGIGILLVFGFFVHNRFYSMHYFYRERLSEAFFTERSMTEGKPSNTGVTRGKLKVDMTPCRILLSNHRNGKDAAGMPMPTLLVGAAVNASDKSVGFGTGAAPYLFSPDASGSNDLGWTPTHQLEQKRRDGGSDLTLPAMVAISGAALSPVMGRFTVSSFRFLLALLNVRLGVWVKRPTRPGQPDEAADRPTAEREPRSRTARILASLKRGWLEPGALYVLREGLGQTSLNSRFVYVTDGGHWENLGLYELVRRRCTHIVVLDATNNPKHPLADFGRCCQLMFSRLGVTVRMDPDDWRALETDGDDSRAVAIGEIQYPDAPAGLLIYCRSSLWNGAPHELALYSRLEGRFPRHSTSNQFLTADQFDAYRRLGWEVGCLASNTLKQSLTNASLDESTDGEPQDKPPGFAIVG